jgi:hypothetical protein
MRHGRDDRRARAVRELRRPGRRQQHRATEERRGRRAGRVEGQQDGAAVAQDGQLVVGRAHGLQQRQVDRVLAPAQERAHGSARGGGRSRALIVPNVEEFGIIAVEAQAAGRPVIGLAAGGTGETVIDGRTGILLERQDVQLLATAMLDADVERFDPTQLVEHAARFGPARFRTQLGRRGHAPR